MTSRAKKKLDDRFTREMSEAAAGMRSLGVMDEATYKLTMRDLNRAAPEETVTPLTAARGVLNERGRPFNPKSVSVLLAS